MKKILLFFAIAFTIFSCSNEPSQEQKTTIQGIAGLPSGTKEMRDLALDGSKDTILTKYFEVTGYGTYTYPKDSVVRIRLPYKAPVVTPPVTNPLDTTVNNPTTDIIPSTVKLVWSPNLNKPLPKNSIGQFIDGEFRAGQMTNASIVTKDGQLALRLSVKATDGNTSSGFRDEVQSFIADNGDMWYEWEQNWESLPTGGSWDGHSWQFHPDNDRGSATLGLWSEAGTFEVHHNPSGGQSGAIMKTIGATKKITPGKWYKQILHVKWSNKSDGIIEYWIDGVKYIDFRGITAQTGVYYKLGLNRWLMKKDATVFYRNIKTYK